MDITMDVIASHQYRRVIDEICDLNWPALTQSEMASAAWAYYFFSIQFRENLEIAIELHPDDSKLRHLKEEECDTANLSPWPGIATPGERMNHDEYMRRALELVPIDSEQAADFTAIGKAYLADIRGFDPVSRALSIASYEDGGLEKVFRAILRFRHWDNALLQSFEHFLEEHVRFDSNPDQGHGALSRHLAPDDRVLPLWDAFKDILVTCVPRLSS
jgi:hypothetical protein